MRRHSQVVRQRSATPLSPGSNPGDASKEKRYPIRDAVFLSFGCATLDLNRLRLGAAVLICEQEKTIDDRFLAVRQPSRASLALRQARRARSELAERNSSTMRRLRSDTTVSHSGCRFSFPYPFRGDICDFSSQVSLLFLFR